MWKFLIGYVLTMCIYLTISLQSSPPKNFRGQNQRGVSLRDSTPQIGGRVNQQVYNSFNIRISYVISPIRFVARSLIRNKNFNYFNMERSSIKAPGRSRWNANQQQLQTLEGMFEQGNGNTPNKARIKEIALELSQYGQISETNVYNWFQNRKARAKRKLQHQVGRRRRLTRTNIENVPKVHIYICY